MAAYKVNIGIEVHVQLTTKTKIFCSCANEIAEKPNSNICPICAGHPGTLPVLNKQVVEYAVMAGLATNCSINQSNEFARKHYFYPDLPKGYQITQNDHPICIDGHIPIRLEDGSTKNIRLIRIHMEEDAGKNIHAPFSNESFVDLNRAGTPLLEIVTHPDITSAYEARTYLKTLRQIIMSLNICSGNMEEGAFRADTNISIRPEGSEKLGTKVELKNINSFKFISDAIEHEIERQAAMLDKGERIIQETRLWDTKEHKTISMRSKEEAADYRYFPDPDLPRIEISDEYIAAIKTAMPELPTTRLDRYIKQGLTQYEADVLVDNLEVAHYYDAAAKHTQSKLLINWVLRDVMGFLKNEKVDIAHYKLTPEYCAELVNLLDLGVINNRSAQEVFQAASQTGASPKTIVKERGLEQMGDTGELETIIKEIITNNPNQVTQFKAGNEKLLGFFVGQAMAKTKGRGNPELINSLIKKYLNS